MWPANGFVNAMGARFGSIVNSASSWDKSHMRPQRIGPRGVLKRVAGHMRIGPLLGDDEGEPLLLPEICFSEELIGTQMFLRWRLCFLVLELKEIMQNYGVDHADLVCNSRKCLILPEIPDLSARQGLIWWETWLIPPDAQKAQESIET